MRSWGIGGLLVAGLVLVAASLWLNELTHWVVLATVDDLNRGAPLANYREALLSWLQPRATIRLVPAWANALMGSLGVVCWYLAGFLKANPERSLRDLTRLRYWVEGSLTWAYTPFEERLAQAKAARLAAQKTTPP